MWKDLRATLRGVDARQAAIAERRKISAEAMAYHLAFSEPGDPCDIADCPEPTHKRRRDMKEN